MCKGKEHAGARFRYTFLHLALLLLLLGILIRGKCEGRHVGELDSSLCLFGKIQDGRRIIRQVQRQSTRARRETVSK